jgi:hypothetical protein
MSAGCRPPLNGETARASPACGGPVPDPPTLVPCRAPQAGHTGEGSKGAGGAVHAEAPSPPPGPLTRADLPNSGEGDPHGKREEKVPSLSAGRTCPLDYFYDPAVFARPADFAAEILYVAGGLYGNLAAAHAIERLAAGERGSIAIVYNGDFHWFDAEDEWFDAVERAVTPHRALRGNVETEIARTLDIGAGCGCAYPSAVADDVVMRSNLILNELRSTADRAPSAQARLAGLPMHLVAEIGGLCVGIVHGDATSLAGWGFTREVLAAAPPTRLAELRARSRVDVFASTHTCLALLHDSVLGNGRLTVINNGAAGMANFKGTRHGLISRIATTPSPHRPLYGLKRDGVHIDALAVHYDRKQFLSRFLARWPAGTPAYVSYAQRIFDGPACTIAQALGSAAE